MRDPVYHSTPPTVAEGQIAHPQCDASGRLLVKLPTGGGGGAVTIADGADAAEGTTTDAAAAQGGTGTISAKLRTVTAQLNTLSGYLDGVETLLAAGNASTASIDTKASSLATAANQTTQITAEQATQALLAKGQGTAAQSLSVVLSSDGPFATNFGVTTDAPVADNTTVASATAATGIGLWKRLVNLGIAILAKLPALGTAGTASANVITVQGIAAGVPLPISGSFTIPAFDYQAFTYIGSTNNVSTQVFKSGGSGGTTAATLTFTYVAAGAADNDKIASITRS